MLILVFVENRKPALQAASEALAAERYPGAHVALRNPAFYHRGDVEKCGAVVVESRWGQLVEDYRAAGIEVVLSDQPDYVAPAPVVPDDNPSTAQSEPAPDPVVEVRTPLHVAPAPIEFQAPAREVVPERKVMFETPQPRRHGGWPKGKSRR